MQNYKKKMIPSAIILGMDLIFIALIPSQVKELTHDAVTTRFMPYLVCILIAVCAAADLFQIWLRERKNKLADKVYFNRAGLIRVILGMMAVGVYLLILPYVGFVISSVILTAAAMYLMGNRSVVCMLIVSIVLSMVVYCVFKLGLNLRLPTGLFFF